MIFWQICYFFQHIEVNRLDFNALEMLANVISSFQSITNEQQMWPKLNGPN